MDIIAGTTWANRGHQMTSELRASAGAGIVIPVAGMGRIEINAGAPLTHHQHDQRVHFQFGIGTDFS
jgi:outer membrane protein assembly factor BamA